MSNTYYDFEDLDFPPTPPEWRREWTPVPCNPSQIRVWESISPFHSDTDSLPSVRELLNFTPPDAQRSPLATKTNRIISDRPHKMESISDEARKLLGQSGGPRSAAHTASESKVSKGKGRVVGTKRFTGPILTQLALIAITHAPFLAAHNEKGATWAKIRDEFVKSAAGKGFEDVSATVIQHKVKAMVAYKKNPDSTDAQVKAIAHAVTPTEDNKTDHRIAIQTALERLEAQYDESQNKSDEKKAKTKKKQEDDTVGGALIRDASMKTLTRKRLDDSDDSENSESPVKLENKAKRRRHFRRESSGNSRTELLEAFKKDAENRKTHHQTVEGFMEEARKEAARTNAILSDFLEIERAKAGLRAQGLA